MGLTAQEKVWWYLYVSIRYTSVTDGQTDGHWPTASTALCIASRGKNEPQTKLFVHICALTRLKKCVKCNDECGRCTGLGQRGRWANVGWSLRSTLTRSPDVNCVSTWVPWQRSAVSRQRPALQPQQTAPSQPASLQTRRPPSTKPPPAAARTVEHLRSSYWTTCSMSAVRRY